ncbi:transposase family protein [Spiroplasma endosymbiont of Aleiodes alternator]|uniref:transposase family protein n=1 Tax=Spiroplasma endosymbiont of Aleiodes alternator TaxID=3139329 RepID=UPI003CCAADCE
MYSIKFQLIYDVFNKTIVDVFCDKGKVHDFQILKNSNLKFEDKTMIFVDSGYQGLQKINKNTWLPIKKTKNKKLKKQEKQFNKSIHKIRIKIEHVFAWLKRFKILVNKCRKSILRLMYLRFNLLCEIFNKIKPLK